MARRVGFGDGDDDRVVSKGAVRSGPSGSGWRIMAAIVVSLGVIVWIVAGLGGPDDFLDTLVGVANGERALIDEDVRLGRYSAEEAARLFGTDEN